MCISRNREKRPLCSAHKTPFQQGRTLFSELGYTSWDQRRQIYQLERSEKVLRELRVLDAQVMYSYWRDIWDARNYVIKTLYDLRILGDNI